MTMTQALHSFMNSFDIPAYPVHTVPKDVDRPYITYTKTLNGSGEINVHYHTASELEIDNKVEEIINELKNGGKVVGYLNGAFYIHLETPSWYKAETQDPKDKHVVINIYIDNMSMF